MKVVIVEMSENEMKKLLEKLGGSNTKSRDNRVIIYVDGEPRDLDSLFEALLEDASENNPELDSDTIFTAVLEMTDWLKAEAKKGHINYTMDELMDKLDEFISRRATTETIVTIEP